METPKFIEFSVTVKLTVHARMELEAYTVVQGMMRHVVSENCLSRLAYIGDIVPSVTPHRRASDMPMQRDSACLLPGAAA